MDRISDDPPQPAIVIEDDGLADHRLPASFISLESPSSELIISELRLCGRPPAPSSGARTTLRICAARVATACVGVGGGECAMSIQDTLVYVYRHIEKLSHVGS